MSVKISELPSTTTLGDSDNLVIDNGTATQKINAKTLLASTVDSALSSTSTNPVQNKVVNSALSDKAGSAVDNLTSTSTTNALSANQGRVLKELVDTNTSNISTNKTNIATNTSNISTNASEIAKVKGGTFVIGGTTITLSITES